MQTQVKTWGNSLGVRLPKAALKDAGIHPEDTLEIRVSDGSLTLFLPLRHRTLEERAEEYGGDLGIDGEFDWGDPLGREVW